MGPSGDCVLAFRMTSSRLGRHPRLKGLQAVLGSSAGTEPQTPGASAGRVYGLESVRGEFIARMIFLCSPTLKQAWLCASFMSSTVYRALCWVVHTSLNSHHLGYWSFSQAGGLRFCLKQTANLLPPGGGEIDATLVTPLHATFRQSHASVHSGLSPALRWSLLHCTFCWDLETLPPIAPASAGPLAAQGAVGPAFDS